MCICVVGGKELIFSWLNSILLRDFPAKSINQSLSKLYAFNNIIGGKEQIYVLWLNGIILVKWHKRAFQQNFITTHTNLFLWQYSHNSHNLGRSTNEVKLYDWAVLKYHEQNNAGENSHIVNKIKTHISSKTPILWRKNSHIVHPQLGDFDISLLLGINHTAFKELVI